MLKSFLLHVSDVLLSAKHQSDFESFIESRNPQTPADVDHAIQIYEDRQRLIAKAIADNDYNCANWIRAQY